MISDIIRSMFRIRFNYDEIISGAEEYSTCGLIKGNDTFVILKTGEKGNIYGYKNKWLKIALRLYRKFGVSVLTSATRYTGKDELTDLIGTIKSRCKNPDQLKVYFMGLSNGALIGLRFGKEHPEIRKMLLVNTNFSDGLQYISSFLQNSTSLETVFIHGEKDPGFQIARLLAKENAANCKMVIIQNADHNFTGMLKCFIQLPEKYLLGD